MKPRIFTPDLRLARVEQLDSGLLGRLGIDPGDFRDP